MIKNKQLPYCCKNRLPPETCFYSNIDPLDPHCCNNRSLGATCFYSNLEPTKKRKQTSRERARWIHNAVKTGLPSFFTCLFWTFSSFSCGNFSAKSKAIKSCGEFASSLYQNWRFQTYFVDFRTKLVNNYILFVDTKNWESDCGWLKASESGVADNF